MKFPYEPMEVKEQCSAEGIVYFIVQTKSSRDGWEVADIRPDIPNQSKVAELFAAAPDLLEALEAWIIYNDDGEDGVDSMLRYTKAIDMTRAAIAKARGSE